MLQLARGLHFIRRGTVVKRNVVIAVKARQHVLCLTVWFTGFVRWIVIATYNLLTWASSSCVNQELSCLLALLKFTHSYLVSSTRLVRRADDFIF